MQVHEISRKALDALIESGRVEDWGNGNGDYVIVACTASYNSTPSYFELQDYFQSEYWACNQADERQNFSLDVTAKVKRGCSLCPYYEVWHIVDDDEHIICYCVVPFRKYEDRYNEDIAEAPNGEFYFETEQEANYFAINLASMTYPNDNKHLLFSKVDVIKDIDHLETPLFTYFCGSKRAKVVSF